MAAYNMRTLGLAGSIIGLAAVAAWLGLAHSCDPETREAVIAGRVMIASALADQVPFELTNADVMVQGSELRGMLDVIARLDRDGQAGPAQPGDIEGRYAKNPTLPGGRDFEITLDTVH